MAQMIAIWFEAVFELRLGNAERVAELARQGRRSSMSSHWLTVEPPSAGFAAGR